MQAADTPQVEEDVQRALANESATTLFIAPHDSDDPPLTVNDARRIIACLENPRLDTLFIRNYRIHDAALNAFRNGLPFCTSVTTVTLDQVNLSNEDLDHIRPAFYNTSVRKLDLAGNHIQGRRGGEVFRDLLIGNNTLVELSLNREHIGREGFRDLGQGLAFRSRLLKLHLPQCYLGNEGVANLLPADGMSNNCLTDLDLSLNNIEGEDGGRQLTLLLQRFPKLKVLRLGHNQNLGPLGARALAPGIAAANHLERLELHSCRLSNDGVANLIPERQVNRTLTHLNLQFNNIAGTVGGENVVALASRCTNLDELGVGECMVGDIPLSPDQQRRLDMLLDRKRLCTEASALGGSPFSVLFRFVEKAHRHEHSLGAIFVILQNDGDDYFCTALNRAIDH